jgi:4-amino-4-deoxy-L-arabinose transferase-like glycosyltransferase
MHALLEREATRQGPSSPRVGLTPLPTRVVDWLPFLWTRALFPGSADPIGLWRWHPFLLVLLVPAALLYPCLSFALFEPDEGRYAQIPREMLQAGDWVVPTLQGEPYLDKPPLFYWLVMLAYAGLGCHDWAARLVPALALHGSVLLTYLLGRRLVGNRAALWGALLLAVSPGFLSMGRLLLLDGVLTFWLTLAMFTLFLAQAGTRLHRGWWLLAALACGLGILTKGPVAIVLPLVPLWAHRRLMPPRARIALGDGLVFAAVVLAIALPWYVLVCCRLPEFARHFLWEHNVMRFAQPFDHIRPVWFYLPVMAAGMLPAALFAPSLARFLLSGKTADACRRSPELGYLLLSGGWCVLFFSLSGCKLPTYVLSAFAPLCLAAGVGLAARRWHCGRVLPAVLACCGLLLAVAHYAVIPWYAWQHSPLNGPGELLAQCRDPSTPVVCFSRSVDSVSFYVGRSDFRSFRSKQRKEMLAYLDQHPRIILLFSHRHSIDTLRQLLPPHLNMTETAPLGPCEMALIERVPDPRSSE